MYKRMNDSEMPAKPMQYHMNTTDLRAPNVESSSQPAIRTLPSIHFMIDESTFEIRRQQQQCAHQHPTHSN